MTVAPLVVTAEPAGERCACGWPANSTCRPRRSCWPGSSRWRAAAHRGWWSTSRALTFCDSAGLTTFVRGDRRCAEAGGWLRLTGAYGHVARVIEISGVGGVPGLSPVLIEFPVGLVGRLRQQLPAQPRVGVDVQPVRLATGRHLRIGVVQEGGDRRPRRLQQRLAVG